jgi:hypothetical protein
MGRFICTVVAVAVGPGALIMGRFTCTVGKVGTVVEPGALIMGKFTCTVGKVGAVVWPGALAVGAAIWLAVGVATANRTAVGVGTIVGSGIASAVIWAAGAVVGGIGWGGTMLDESQAASSVATMASIRVSAGFRLVANIRGSLVIVVGS